MVLSKKDLGEKIKEARKIKSANIGKRYTGEMLASDIGISRSYLGDIESGRTYPNYVLLNKIADACNVPFSFFGDISDAIFEMINKEYPNMSEDDKLGFAKYLSNQMDDEIARTVDLDVFKNMYDDYKNCPDISYYDDKYSEEHNYMNEIHEDESPYEIKSEKKIYDVKEAMETIMSQPGLMLNGEMLSDESKIALANAIKMGLAYAQQMQEKEKKNTKEK